MRVALLSPLFESVPPRLYGGTERIVDQLCRSLERAGVQVTLFASGDSETAGELRAVTDKALRLRHPPPRDPYLYNLQMLSMIAQSADQFDVIHNHHDYWMLPLSEMTTTPVLTTLHGRLDLSDIRPVFTGFPRAKFISISNAQRALMPELPWVRTIHHGIDISGFRYHPEPGSYLAFLGRIHPEKRPEWAIEIAKKSGIPLKIAAKIEGADGQEYYDQMVRPLVDGKFIEYVGEISESEKSEFLGRALGLVFPVDWPEPFGLVMIEALACGTPVLARPCGAVPEVIESGITGFLSMNLESLAKKALQLKTLDRAKCRSSVERRFSVSRMTEDYINVYRALAGRTHRNHSETLRHLADNSRRDLLHPLERRIDGDSEDFVQG